MARWEDVQARLQAIGDSGDGSAPARVHPETVLRIERPTGTLGIAAMDAALPVPPDPGGTGSAGSGYLPHFSDDVRSFMAAPM